MLDKFPWISLLPPVLTIVMAVWSRHIYLSLFLGLVLGFSILLDGNLLGGVLGALDSFVLVFSDPGNTKMIIFTVLIGSLLATVERSGGIKGFVNWVESKPVLSSGVKSQWMAWIIGVVIFVEGNLTILVSGAVTRPLFDRFRIAREKLAYIIDSTSAPICILIPLNAWGAYNLTLLSGLGIDNPIETLLGALAYNFYAVFAVLMVAVVIKFNWNIGPMRAAEKRTAEGEILWPDSTPLMDTEVLARSEPELKAPRVRNLLIPIISMVVAMIGGLVLTGGGNPAKGDGTNVVLWSVLIAITIAWIMVLTQRIMSLDALTKAFMEGAGSLMPLVLVIALALAFGGLTQEMGAGRYLATMLGEEFSAAFLLPLVFLTSAIMAFSIGTSWGTFAIMIPTAVPLALSLGMSPAPFVAAVLSGGIFGDHASPISDTTIVSSMASASDHIDHVKTQLPYALICGGLAALCFFLLGWLGL